MTKSGIIYIKRREVSGASYTTWKTLYSKSYNSCAQRKVLMKSLAEKYGVDNYCIVLSVEPVLV